MTPDDPAPAPMTPLDLMHHDRPPANASKVRRQGVSSCNNVSDDNLLPPPSPTKTSNNVVVTGGYPTGNSHAVPPKFGFMAAVDQPPLSPRRGAHTERDYIKEILQHIRSTIARTEKGERDDVIREEWRAVASVMDRTFFVLACVSICTVVPVLLFNNEHSHPSH